MIKTLEERTDTFKKGLEKLIKETQVGIRAQITPDGPIDILVDLAPKEEKKESPIITPDKPEIITP